MRHEIILQRFFDQHDPLDVTEELVDEVISLKVEHGLRENLVAAIDRLIELLPSLERPHEASIDEALEWVGSYDPTLHVKKEAEGRPTTPPRYFALAPEIDVVATARKALLTNVGVLGHLSSAVVDPVAFLDQLIANDRITSKPHITLVHEKTVAEESIRLNPVSIPSTAISSSPTTSSDSPSSHQPLEIAAIIPDSLQPLRTGPIALSWNHCQTLAADPRRPLFTFRITHLVWNARVMALVVKDISSSSCSGIDVVKLPLDDEDGMHMTVGTADIEIPAVESRPLVKAFRAGMKLSEDVGVLTLPEEGEVGKGRVKGLS